MFKFFVTTVFVITAFISLSFAQEKTFDSELSSLRKEVIAMCAQLQMGKPNESQEQLLKEIDSIISGWERMEVSYKDAPPKEYSKDPSWKLYFSDIADNFKIMHKKTEDKDYARAMQFCGQNCGLFVKIHQVNGKTTLSDKMFFMRQNIRLAMNMAKANNWNGASKLLKNTKTLFSEIDTLAIPEKVNKNEYIADIKQLKKTVNLIAEAFEKKDINKLNDQFKGFLKGFGEIYVKYV